MAPLSVEISLHSSIPPNPLEGYRHALTDPPDCTHLLVIQDDASVCADFAYTLQRVVAAQPADPIALFLAKLPRVDHVASLKALQADKRFIALRGYSFCPVVAVVWPIDKAEQFLRWSLVAKLPGGPRAASDDAAVGLWIRTRRNRVLACVPSIVQHPDEEASIIGKRSMWGKDKARTSEIFQLHANELEW